MHLLQMHNKAFFPAVWNPISALLWLEDFQNTNTSLEIRMSKGTAFTGDQRQSKVIKGDQNHPTLESWLVTGTALTTWGPGNVLSFSSQIHPITAELRAHIPCSYNWMKTAYHFEKSLYPFSFVACKLSQK